MPSKKTVLGACLLIAGAASASNHIRQYIVKAGDNDWVIAHRLGTTVPQLQKLNPGIDWHHLKIGSHLNLPGQAASTSAQFSTPVKFTSRYAVVDKDNAVIRRGPSADEEKITLVDSGTRVTVLNSKNGWYQLRFPKGTVGWMRADLLKPASAQVVSVKTTQQPKVAARANRTPTISRAASNVQHPTSSSAHRTVASLHKPVARPAGASKVVTASAITTPPAQNSAIAVKAAIVPAKVEKAEVKKETASNGPTDQQLLSRAMRLRGTRYVYGGLSSRGLDCSGFTTTVFKSVGIHLPRTSRSQASVGIHVGRGNLEPGDLVLFRTGRSSRINHVGMYIGDDKFIHAASGYGAVRVDNLKGHYSHELATARRLPIVRHVIAGESVERDAVATPPKSAAPAPTTGRVAAKPAIQPDPPELPAPTMVMPKKAAAGSKPDTH